MICRTTFHWLHADWEIWANALSEPTIVDTSISSSIEAHKDKLDGNDEPNDGIDGNDSIQLGREREKDEKWINDNNKNKENALFPIDRYVECQIIKSNWLKLTFEFSITYLDNWTKQ